MRYTYCKACKVREERCLLPDSHRAQNRHVHCADFLLGGKHGKRIRKQFKPGVTAKEVDKYEHLMIADFERGTFIPAGKSKTPIANIIDKYDREHIQEQSRHPNGSVKYYLKELKNLVGYIAIGALTLEQLIAARSKFKEDTGSSNANVNKCFAMLKAALNYAVLCGFIQSNPAVFLKPLPIATPEPRFLPPDELSRVWTECLKDKRTEYFAVALAHTAIRPINIKEMEWPQVNFGLRLITYTTWKGRKPRTVTCLIDDELMRVLKLRYAETGGTGKVFDTSNLRKLVEAAILRAGINEGKAKKNKFTIYGLKHCYVSYLLLSGAKLDEVAKLTGVSMATLEKHYAKYSNEHLRAVQAKINLTPALQPEFKVI